MPRLDEDSLDENTLGDSSPYRIPNQVRGITKYLPPSTPPPSPREDIPTPPTPMVHEARAGEPVPHGIRPVRRSLFAEFNAAAVGVQPN